MRKFALAIMGAFLFLTNLQAEESLFNGGLDILMRRHCSHSHHHPKKVIVIGVPGPVGPPGPTGPAGSLAVAYASAYEQDLQIIPTAGVYSFVSFPIEQLPPVGIVHPFVSDSFFQVVNSGVYLVGFTLGLNNGTTDFVSARLINVQSLVPFNPDPIASTTVPGPGSQTTLSGQVLLPLTAGTVIGLQVNTLIGDLHVIKPSIEIVQVAPL